MPYLVRFIILGVLQVQMLSACFNSPALHPSDFVKKVEKPEGAVIFVHGVFGGSDASSGTWFNARTQVSWPQLIGDDPSFSRFDVFVVNYGSPYMGQTSNIEQVAQRVFQQLLDHGLFDYKNLYIIAHSMGGLITKRVIVELKLTEHASASGKIKAVLFLSTPAQGAPIAEVGSWLSANPQLKDMEPSDFNTFLQTLENQWERFLRERDRARDAYPRVFCAYETRRTGPVRVVTRLYANSRCDNIPYPIDLNHLEIVKPPDRSTDPYPWAKARMIEAQRLGTANTPPLAGSELRNPPAKEQPLAKPRPQDVSRAAEYNENGNVHWKNATGTSSYGEFDSEMMKAMQAYRIAESLVPSNALYAINVGTTLSRLGRYDEAIVKLRRGVQLDPTVAWYHNELCVALTKLRFYQEAEPECRAAVRLDPQNSAFQDQLQVFIGEAEAARRASE
jgi:hypothetical protein